MFVVGTWTIVEIYGVNFRGIFGLYPDWLLAAAVMIIGPIWFVTFILAFSAGLTAPMALLASFIVKSPPYEGSEDFKGDD
jgi:hypothetical protein